MRFAFGLLLLLHAALHLIGFSRAFGLSDSPMPLTDLWEARPIGALWLVTALAVATAGVLVMLRDGNWLIAAAPALVLSQALIFAFWADAKTGTFVNALLLVGIALGWAEQHFDEATERSTRVLADRWRAGVRGATPSHGPVAPAVVKGKRPRKTT